MSSRALGKQAKLAMVLCAVMLAHAVCAAPQSPGIYAERYRPQYHFSPAAGWIGDPDGLIHYQGRYSMFWWGKAVSSDLVHYTQESSKVMVGDNGKVGYFSGSVVVDKNNTAGFGANTQVAVYTLSDQVTRNQSQAISYSLDGKSFQFYANNPVLDIGSTEFRDPTVFWHEGTSRWVMAVAMALEKKIKFYSSPDLKTWTWLSDFGPAGAHERAWECPDLFQLAVDGDAKHKKWVMVVSIDWAREQYFIGDFDGATFTLDKDFPAEPLYVDQGLDFYASRTFRDYDNTLTRTTSLGWIATWDYAQKVPSTWGKGFWSIPRDLELKTFTEGVRLIQKPIDNLHSLRQSPIAFKTTIAPGTSALKQFEPSENVYELDLEFATDVDNTFGINLCVGDGRKLVLRYDTRSQLLSIDRSNTADVPIDKFSRTAAALVRPVNKRLRLHIYVDKSSVEIFANEGKEVFTLLTYAGDLQTGLELYADRSGTSVSFKAWRLQSIWK